MADIEIEDVNGYKIYSLETPGGQRWSWEDDDLNEEYIVGALWAWSRLLDFVKARNAS